MGDERLMGVGRGGVCGIVDGLGAVTSKMGGCVGEVRFGGCDWLVQICRARQRSGVVDRTAGSPWLKLAYSTHLSILSGFLFGSTQ